MTVPEDEDRLKKLLDAIKRLPPEKPATPEEEVEFHIKSIFEIYVKGPLEAIALRDKKLAGEIASYLAARMKPHEGERAAKPKAADTATKLPAEAMVFRKRSEAVIRREIRVLSKLARSDELFPLADLLLEAQSRLLEPFQFFEVLVFMEKVVHRLGDRGADLID